jgi:predicted  nucleic acid-binding Zn-ribbon protein
MKAKKTIATVAAFAITVVLAFVALSQSNLVKTAAEMAAINSMQKEVEMIVKSLEDDAAISITEEIGREIRGRYNAASNLRLIFVDIDKAWTKDPSLTEKFGFDNIVLKYKLANNSLSDEVLKKISEVPGTPSFDYIKNEVVSNFNNNMWSKTEVAIGEVEAMIAGRFLPYFTELKAIQVKMDNGVAPTKEDAQLVEYVLDGLPALLDARYDILHNGVLDPTLGLSVKELEGSMHDANVSTSSTRKGLNKYTFAFNYNNTVKAIDDINFAKSIAVWIYLGLALVVAIIVAGIVWKKATVKQSEKDMLEKAEAALEQQQKVDTAKAEEAQAAEAHYNAVQELEVANAELEQLDESIEANSVKADEVDTIIETAEGNVKEAETNLKNNRFSQELAKKEQELIDNTISSSEIAAATDFAKDEEELKDINSQLASVSDGSQLIKKVVEIREHAEHTFAKKIPLTTMVKELDAASAKIGNFHLNSLINKLKALPKTMRKPDAEKQKFAAEVVETCTTLEKELKDSTLKLGTLQARKEEIENARNTLGNERVEELRKLSKMVTKCFTLTGEINELKGRVDDLQAGPEAARDELKKVQDQAAITNAEIQQERDALLNQRNQIAAKITATELKLQNTKSALESAKQNTAAVKAAGDVEPEETKDEKSAKQVASGLLKKVGAVWNSIPLPKFHKTTISCIAGALVVLVVFF